MKYKAVMFTVIGVLLATVVYLGVTKNAFDFVKSKSSYQWQAIFLDNGQVYFGKVKNLTKQYVSLSDIYYLQVDQQSNLQPSKEKTDKAVDPKVSLVKLGNELHGPVDQMKINREHVIFIEDLKSDSKVVTAISDYLKDKNK